MADTSKREKPPKPFAGFPLYPHGNGQWAKMIDGKRRYFGPWNDWQAAYKKYLREQEAAPETLENSIKRYLKSREPLQQSGELSQRHVKDIERTLDGIKALFGKRLIAGLGSEEFGTWRAKLAETNNVVSIGNHVMRVRAFLNWAIREKIIDEMPGGDNLKKPSRKQLRRARAAKGSRMFEPEEIRQLLVCGGPVMRAMILLALNCGLGNTDLALLEKKHIQGVWLNYPRPKTGVERRVPLWPETRKALAAVIREDDDVIFRTKYGNKWDSKSTAGSDSPISLKFRSLCEGLGLHKKGRGFYSLRHVCQTLGEESGDHAATSYILAHVPPADDMASVYRERMSDRRLFRVVKFIRKWLGLPKHKIDIENLPEPKTTGIVLNVVNAASQVETNVSIG